MKYPGWKSNSIGSAFSPHRHKVIYGWLVLLASLCLPLTATATEFCAYVDFSFLGAKKCWSLSTDSETSVADLGEEWDNKFSSITIPPGYYVVLYTDKNFQGAKLRVNRSTEFLNGWPLYVKSISSLKAHALPEGAQEKVCFYSGYDYRGNRDCWEVPEFGGSLDIPDLGAFGQHTYSITIPPAARVTLFRDTNLSGSSKVFDKDNHKLDNEFWPDATTGEDYIGTQVKSLRIENLVGRQLLVNGDASGAANHGWASGNTGCWTIAGGKFQMTPSHNGTCSRNQEVDLKKFGFSPVLLARQPMIAVSQEIFGSICSDTADMKIELLDSDRQVIQTWDSGSQALGSCDDPQNKETWKRTLAHTFSNYGPSVRYLRWKDTVRSSSNQHSPSLDNAIAMVLADDHPAFGSNLVSNPSGKNGTGGWDPTSGLTLTAESESHAPFLRMKPNGDAGSGAAIDVDLWKNSLGPDALSGQFIAGLEYRISSTACVANSEDHQLLFRTLYLDKSGLSVGIEDHKNPPEACNEWKKVSIALASNLPPSTRKIQFVIYPGFADGHFDFRNVTVGAAANLLTQPDSVDAPWQTEVPGHHVTGHWNSLRHYSGNGRSNFNELHKGSSPELQANGGHAVRRQRIDLQSLGYSPEELRRHPVFVLEQTYWSPASSNSHDDLTVTLALLDDTGHTIHSATEKFAPEHSFYNTATLPLHSNTLVLSAEPRYIEITQEIRERVRLAGSFLGIFGIDRNVVSADAVEMHRRVVRETSDCGNPGQEVCSSYNAVGRTACAVFSLGFAQCTEVQYTHYYCHDGARAVLGSDPDFYHLGTCHTATVSCCDDVDFGYVKSSQVHNVTKGKVARAYLGGVESIVPTRDSALCPDSHFPNPLKSVAQNTEHTSEYNSAWWGSDFTDVPLMFNANFFTVRLDSQSHHPYREHCTSALGLAMSNGTTISPISQVHGTNTDTLVILTDAAAKRTGIFADITSSPHDYEGDIEDAVSGFFLLRKGQFVPQPDQIDPNNPRPRTAVGLTEEKDELIIVTVNPGGDRDPGGTPLEALALYLRDLGAHDALTLDGSGSSQLLYRHGNDVIKTLPSDVLRNPPVVIPGGPYYRPVPIFLGLKPRKDKRIIHDGL